MSEMDPMPRPGYLHQRVFGEELLDDLLRRVGYVATLRPSNEEGWVAILQLGVCGGGGGGGVLCGGDGKVSHIHQASF